MELLVKLNDFEGPLDLLLHLIKKEKMNIYDIHIVEVTNQYLEYIKDMKENLDSMSEFIVMAGTLIDIKTRMLFPAEEEEIEDPRDELVRQLIEYKMYKNVSEELNKLREECGEIVCKPPTIPKEISEYKEAIELDFLLKDISLNKLFNIYQELIKKQEDKIDPIRSKFSEIKEEIFTVSDRMTYVNELLGNCRKLYFSQIFNSNSSKVEVVVTFLAILELMKTGKIFIEQEEIFDEIIIKGGKHA